MWNFLNNSAITNFYNWYGIGFYKVPHIFILINLSSILVVIAEVSQKKLNAKN